MESSYNSIVQRLKEEFVQGTVQFREDTNRPYIPNQVYLDRLENATNSEWSKELRDLEISVSGQYVKAIVRVIIGEQFRDGYGIALLNKKEAGDVTNLANATDIACERAFINAIDTWQMGWANLAPYKKEDWGSNPALKHLLAASPPAASPQPAVQSREIQDRYCLVCNSKLSLDEWSILGEVRDLNREKMTYCYTHLPDHMKRKLPTTVRNAYESSLS